MKKLLFMILVLGFFSCSDYNPNKPTTFCKITNKRIYVVNNVPNDTLLLKKEIEKFIFQSQYLDSLKRIKRENGRKNIWFLFYRGDKYLTCDFREGEPYKIVPWHITLDTIQDLRYHTQIAEFEWAQRIDSVWRYDYWLRLSREESILKNAKSVKFNDIDSLFRAKQKEYGIK
ncbi:hypothetical protein [Capnocytophaga canimorsus]|uniref:hypothetical protein n=1 Tax=Capnocytophaga canimorsus TaxID=28188 RepID=UPI000F4E9D8A|nr:hypothetical protein [Capnocytophaga canimorsus]